VEDGEINVIGCPTTEKWADIMAKPLQGTGLHVMRAELIKFPVKYEDPMEEEELSTKQQPIPAPRTVTWKSVVAIIFKTPQECVGQNRNQHTMVDKKRYHDKAKFPCRNQHRTTRVARLAMTRGSLE
jgi:hypothetical protein